MPHWEESIKGDREAVRIEKEMKERYRSTVTMDGPLIQTSHEEDYPPIDIAHARLIKEATRQSAEMRGSAWKADLRQFAACCLMALAGLGFAVLIMLVARYH